MNMLPGYERHPVASETRALGRLEFWWGKDSVSHAMLLDGRKRVQIAQANRINFFPVREILNPDPTGVLHSVSGLKLWVCTSVSQNTFKLSPCKPPKRVPEPPVPHTYERGYWMSSDDMLYVLEVILDTTITHPQPYQTLFDDLKQQIERPASRGSGVHARWDKWFPYIVNSDKRKGAHWMLVIIKFAETPKLILWDSLGTNYYGSKVVSYFNNQFNGNIKPHITRKQHDGWRCGYFASFWYICPLCTVYLPGGRLWVIVRLEMRNPSWWLGRIRVLALKSEKCHTERRSINSWAWYRGRIHEVYVIRNHRAEWASGQREEVYQRPTNWLICSYMHCIITIASDKVGFSRVVFPTETNCFLHVCVCVCVCVHVCACVCACACACVLTSLAPTLRILLWFNKKVPSRTCLSFGREPFNPTQLDGVLPQLSSF